MMIKYKLGIKRSVLLIAFVAISAIGLAFDYKIALQEKTFEDENFNFFIQKVIDARLNKQKPIGVLMAGFSLNKETVGNDSLGEQMTALFAKKPEMFNAATKVIMVINQLNLRYIKSADGKKIELEYTIAIDYYQAGDKSCGLLYQQFFKFKTNVKSADKIIRDINKGFSETIKGALTDFKKQLKTNKVVVRKEFDTGMLLQSLENKPAQILSNQNIKDGLYFSCKDLYLNNPGILDSYSFTDTMGIGRNPLIVKAPGYIMERVYAIVRDKRIFIYAGGGNYKAALLGDDGRLVIAGKTSADLLVDVKGAFASVGILNSIVAVPFVAKTNAPADSTAQQVIKQPEAGNKIPDIFVDLETGDLVYLAP